MLRTVKWPSLPSIQVVLLVIVVAAFQQSADAQVPPKTVTPISQKGPEVLISESFNTGSTGYLLAMTRLSEGLHVVFTEDVSPVQPVPGASSRRTYTFLASKPQAQVTLSHFQPWTPDSMTSSNYSVSVEQTELIRLNKVELRTVHVETNRQFEIKLGEFPNYLMVLQAMSEGIYLVRTEHEDPQEALPGAHGSRVFHFFAGPEFQSGKVVFTYHVPGQPNDGSTIEYSVRTADSELDRFGIVTRPSQGGKGLEIVDLGHGSPADEYRLRKGDVILSVNAEDTDNVDSYLKLIAKPGPFFHFRGRYSNGRSFEFTCQLPQRVVTPVLPQP